MKIAETKSLAITEITVLEFVRFRDNRGYFTEQFRRSDIRNLEKFPANFEFVQANESYSKRGVIRGLHFQWNPFMGKLVRTVEGRMVDMVLDIRKGSPTFGKIILYEMAGDREEENDRWIWVPPGFAHGNFFVEDTLIEYFCTGEYSPSCEAGISPLAKDIDWELCDEGLLGLYQNIVEAGPVISDKDKDGLSVKGWEKDQRSENFVYGKL